MERLEFMIELNGIIETIHTYTRNPFMTGYTKALRRALRQDDMASLRIVLDKVINWYNEEYEQIQADEYVFNKNMHEKAYDLLKTYRHSLQA